MTREEARDRSVEYFIVSAEESLDSAGIEFSAGHLRFSVNRAYYACFYAASAALLNEGRHFVKHAGVRSSLHKHIVKPGRISSEFGTQYDRLFRNRQKGDYALFTEFEPSAVQEYLDFARQFVAEMKRLLAEPGSS